MSKYLYIILFLLSGYYASAQKLTATPSQTDVGVGDVFQIEWSYDGGGGSFTPPATPDFDIVGGPMQGSSTVITNGRMVQSQTLTYVFRAKKAGTFKIPPATIKTPNGSIQSNTVTIKVTQGGSKGGGGNQQKGNGSARGGGNSDAEYFIDATVDKANILEGEPITVTYKLYLRNAQPQQINPKKAPSFTGFWTKDMPDAVDKELHNEDKNGKRYYVATIKKAILYPQHTGTLTIDPIEWDVALAMRAPKRHSGNGFFDDPFEDFFGQQVEVYHKTLQSNVIPIRVNPLPEKGKPQNFNGLVGNFNVRANVDRTKVKENDAITYKLTVEGQGNLQQVQAFALNLPPDWDVYDPKTIDKPGSKTFEYTIIPKKMGKYTLPAVEFSYFDLATRTYHTDKTKEFEIEVLKGNGTPSGPSSGGYSKEDVKLLGQDIRFIKTSSGNLSKDSTNFYGSNPFWIFSILPLFAFGAMIYFRRKNEEIMSDVVGMRKRKATGMARKRLKTAQALMKKGDKQGFYTEVLLALYGYTQNKIGLQLAETSRDAIKQVLSEHHAKGEEIERFVKIVDMCEFAKYASAAVTDNLNEVYNQSVELITNLEEQLR